MDDLASLRTAKAALDEGLITAQDFDVVKVAFLKAQQIKAGLDAGFIRDEDYDKATHAYMHALDFQIMTAMPSLSSGPGTRSDSTGMHGAPTARAAPAAAAPAVPARQPVPPIERGPVAGGVPVRLSSTSTPRAAPTAPAAELGSSSVPSGAASMDEGGGGGGAALLDIPTDLPDYCKGATNGKTSMSGIAIDATCVNLFMHMKTRKQYKWLIFKVDDSGRKVIPDCIGGTASTYNDFVCALPEQQCRYAVYDYEYRSPERGTFKKLVFLLWAPDSCGMRPKMMYASTKDFFKGFLDGIGAELQANEPGEISEEEIKERVISNMTRK